MIACCASPVLFRWCLARESLGPVAWTQIYESSFDSRGLGYKVPTPVQRRAIPVILEGQDTVAMARTGALGPFCGRGSWAQALQFVAADWYKLNMVKIALLNLGCAPIT